MSLEHLFSTSVLSLSVPDTSVEFPPTGPPDEWLETLTSNLQERKQAFFEHPTPYEPADPSHPPVSLITFLAHVQVSLEASYISLPSPGAPSPSPASAALGRAQSTLRKSFRKTLQTVSGFRVCMQTVFVPSVVLDASQEEHDKMASGNEERTVVLCVEIENSGESGNGIGFEVEKVDVAISGDEAKATLITWGRLSFTAQDGVFPLRIAQSAQYNLLYAVTFLRSPEGLDAFSFARKTVNTTHTDLQHPSDPSTAYPSVLPELPSPFPVFGLQTSKPSPTTANLFSSTTPTATVSDVAKGGQLMDGRILKSSTPRMSAVPMSAQPSRMSLLAQVAPQYPHARSPTTYSTPPHQLQLDQLQLDQLQQHHPHERPYSYTGLPPSRTHAPPILNTPTL
ncbi:hypothetical protein D9756_008635 [Leucocoprinus leucothites]|uniref:Uncharacterized protein n=1 Tax=Leucocoprinus leucothites TaxID=201217 RepID=A0A8H5CZ18_9AGAR|nr:hypothetical protein D9756_008635 [Leucoagaricus leucothites]